MRLTNLWFMLVVVLAGACTPITSSAPTNTTAKAAPSATQPASSALVFANVRLFDGEAVTPATTVVVADGLITAVGNDVAPPADAQVIDGAGKTLLPGLIDAHTHVYDENALRQALIFGITTELDMGMDYKLAAQLRQDQRATGAVDRADLFSAGTVATAPGGHGTQFGLEIPTLTSPAQAEEFVAARVAEGSDYLKIILEDGSAWGTPLPSLDQATVAALVQAAHDHGLLALTHIQTLATAKAALAAGSDGLAHIFVDATPDEAFVQEAVANDLFVIATLAVFQSIGGEPVDTTIVDDPLLAPYLTPENVQTLRSPTSGLPGLSLANGQAAVRQLFAAGVPILAGTDSPIAGTTHGASLHRELVLLTEAGLSPLEALRAATAVTADTFGLADRGRIAPGLRADLLLVNGDPTTTITATRDIVGIWKLGVAVDRASYLAQLAAQRAAVAEQQAAFAAQPMAPVSDFEADNLATGFGAGWSGFTDQLVGGASTAELAVADDGAAGTAHSLLVTGAVTDTLPYAWAGVMFSPGARPFAPFDLSSKPLLHFWAKGEGGPYRVQLSCTGVGQMLPEQPLPLTAEWQEFTVDLTTFAGCDLTKVMAIIVATGPAPGPFAFQLDEVTVEGGAGSTPPAAESSPAAGAADLAERVDFAPDAATATYTGTLPAGDEKKYALAAGAGQTIQVQSVGASAPVSFTVYGPAGATWSGAPQADAANTLSTTVDAPANGDYLVTLTAPAATNYAITFTVAMSESQAGPVARVQFPAGESVAERSGVLPAGAASRQFLLSGNAGWTMTVDATSDAAPLSMTIADPTGMQWIPEMQPTDNGYTIGQQFTLPTPGYYLVTLNKADQTPSTTYTVTFTLQSGATTTATTAIQRQALTIDFGDFQSKAELTYPATGAGPFPTVILIPGSSPLDMDATVCTQDNGKPVVLSHIFGDIAEYLSRHGYAVLRYNKHYVTGPCQADYQKFYTQLDLQQLLKDAAQVLATAQKQPQVDVQQIFLYGWSEGSTVAAALALQHPEVAGLIVQGPVTEPWRAIFKYQLTEVGLPYLETFVQDGNVITSTLQQVATGDGGLVAKGVLLYINDPNAMQSGRLTLNPFFDKNHDGVINIDQELRPNVDAYLDQLFQSVFAIYTPERALPPLDEQAPKLTLPVLILQGEQDANVPVQGARQLDAALHANADHTLKVYPGLGHTLGPAASLIDDNFRPIAQPPLADLMAWLDAHSEGSS